MKSNDVVKIIELVSLLMLYILGERGNMESKTWVSTRLTCLHENSGLMFHKRRKDIVETSHENFNPKITITTNLLIVISLDVILDRCTGRYRDYKRPKDTPT